MITSNRVRARIVLVERQSLFRSGLRSLLEQRQDLEVVGEAATFEEALRVTREHSPNLLITGLSLDGSHTGTELARAVQRLAPSVRVMVVTAHDKAAGLRRALEVGVQAYLLKRASRPELLRAVDRVLSGDVYVDPHMIGLMVPTFLGLASTSSTGGEGRSVQLTKREREVCSLIAYGNTNAEAAVQLHISRRTVERHRRNIMVKLGTRTRASLVSYAVEHGLFAAAAQ